MSDFQECRNCSEIFEGDDEGCDLDMGLCAECAAGLRSVSDYW